MTDKEETRICTRRTKSLPKNSTGIFTPKESLLHEELDKNCLYDFDNTLIRVEYPGQVKNPNKAIETLGGIDEIEKALDGKKLELCFHPRNYYMKGCIADVSQSVGILVKVKEKIGKTYYEILGVTEKCFKFNRMSDFQYLPLLPTSRPETKESNVEYIYDKIILDKIPTLEWFTKKDPTHPIFLLSGNFARFDQPQTRFQTNSVDVFNSLARKDAPQLMDMGKRKIKQKIVVSSVRVSLHTNAEIPNEPVPDALENIKSKFLLHQLKQVKQLFEERPIWTKSGVMHKVKINHDCAKHTLPCVAYYCHSGPWRTCWIKFGYNPVNEYNSRVYQILDFRIRHAEGMQVKVKTKRTKARNIAKDFATRQIDPSLSESSYILRPNQLPPARQMFYQYCDILIPEIQEMLLKLPKLPSTSKFDPKNGWLPLSFQEHCREIVNRYIFDSVQQALLKEAREQSIEKPKDVATYCSKMLSNIKKGVSQTIGEFSGAQENVIEAIDLSDDEEIDANEVMNSLPERLPENFEEDDDSDLELDLEAVEEVNKLVAGIKQQKLTI